MMIPLQGILAFGFLSPLLLGAGAAAVSIPIIIHLLNKRRFRVVIWAAMEFLLAAQRRNARRLKLHRWLLLALRCLALLLIAAGMARLVVDSNVLGSILGGRGQRTVVIVWDDSYSMGYTGSGPGGAAGGSAFERSKKLLSAWLEPGGGVGTTDQVVLIRAGRNGVNAANRPTLDHATLLADVRAAQLSDAGTDLAAALDQAGEMLKAAEASARTRQLIVLTDFSNSSLINGPHSQAVGASKEEQLKHAMAAAKTHATSVRVIDIGTETQANLGVTDLQAERPVVVAGTPSRFRVTVVNATQRPQVDVPLQLLVDGVITRREKLGKIEPGAERNVLIETTLPTAGRHAIEARLPADSLPVDDVRRLMLNVQREIPVLLVDGNPGDGTLPLGSTTYLWAAYGLTVDNKTGSVFAPRRITELELPTTVLGRGPAGADANAAGYAEVVLSDTAAPPPVVLDQLQQFVNAGGLLVIFPGNRTNATLMNQSLGKAGLLPATLGQPVRLETSADMAKGIAFDPEGFAHPVLAPFGEAYKSGIDVGFLTVQTTQYFKLGVPTDGSVETLLRYAGNNGEGDAAVVSKSVGKGRVVLFASSADTTWNTFGAKPSFVPFIHELTYYSLPRDRQPLTLRVGDRIHLPANVAAAGIWTAPRNGSLEVHAEMDAAGQMQLTSGPLHAAGYYVPNGGDTKPVVAVNPDADEVDIRHVTPGRMAAAIGIDPKQIATDATALEPRAVAAQVTESGGALIGPGLIAGALALFVAEALLAMAFSTYR